MASSAERASVATVDSVLERELGFRRERLSVQLRVRIDKVVERIALLRWVEPDVSSDSKLQAIVVVYPEQIILLIGMLPAVIFVGPSQILKVTRNLVFVLQLTVVPALTLYKAQCFLPSLIRD